MQNSGRNSGDFGQIAEQLRRSTVRVFDDHGNGDRGSGSGVIWDSEGLILTNAHVVRRKQAHVELWDGRGFPAVVAARDEHRDLAALRINTFGLPAASAADSSRVRAGELVMAVGNPLGFVGALTTGVVHAVGAFAGLGRRPWVQANIRLAPGNSGGPLADAQGRVIGINTMVVSGGLALAAPSNAIVEFLQRGPAVKLGVTIRPVRVQRGARVGLMVLEIEPHSPAEAASLFPGDILISANHSAFTSVGDLGDSIDQAAGGRLVLEFLRGSNASRTVVAMLEKPKSVAA
jgi:serine protease Do